MSGLRRVSIQIWRTAASTSPVVIGLALVGLAIAIHLPTLGQPLVETQSFRQTTTAFPALIYHEEGIDLLRPQVPVFGPPFLLPIEFPLFQAGAALVMDLGVAPDVAVRGTALFWFIISALLVWRLTVAVASEAAGLACLAAYLFSPLALLVSRMAVVDYMSAAGGLAYVLWGLRWHETGRWRWYAIALIAGAAGFLVKSTTSVMYIPPFFVLALVAWWRGTLPLARRAAYLAAVFTLLAVPVLATAAWTIYADGVRAANPASAWFTAAGGNTSYYLGTIGQRLSTSNWRQLAEEVLPLLFGGFWLLVPVALVAGINVARRAFVIALIVSAVLGPLIFMNQYLVPGQEYYLAGLSPLVALAIGLAVGYIWQERERPIAKVLLLAMPLSWGITLYLGQGYWGRQFVGVHDLDQLLPAAAYVAANTTSDELVALAGQDWNPTIFYYARRKGLMLRGETGPATYAALREAGYTRLFWCPGRSSPPTPCQIIILPSP